MVGGGWLPKAADICSNTMEKETWKGGIMINESSPLAGVNLFSFRKICWRFIELIENHKKSVVNSPDSNPLAHFTCTIIINPGRQLTLSFVSGVISEVTNLLFD